MPISPERPLVLDILSAQDDDDDTAHSNQVAQSRQELQAAGSILDSHLAKLRPLLECKRREGRLGMAAPAADALIAGALEQVSRHPWEQRPWRTLRPRALLLHAVAQYLSAAGGLPVQLLLQQVVRTLEAPGKSGQVKLAPRTSEAWNLLAHCCWEAGDLTMARCCLSSGLRHAPTKEGLQQMSMLVRQGRPGSAMERAAALALSAQAALGALKMDESDGYSWYVLAMARMATFFSSEQSPRSAAGRPRELALLLEAFAKAAAGCGGGLADVYYNRAALHTYCQDFQAALRDYEHASAADSRLPCAQQVQSIVSLLAQLSSLWETRGGVKPKQWARIHSLLASDVQKGAELLPRLHYERLRLTQWDELKPGVNSGAALLCRPLVFLAPPLNASGTLYLVCVGAGGACFVVALVRMSHDAVGMTQLLTVVHPEVHNVHVTWKNAEYRFPMVKVDCSTVLVDGVPLAQDLAPEGLLRNRMQVS